MSHPAQDFRLTRENPWPGLQSFTEDGRGFFFGRDEETDALLRLVRRERLTVFYGKSGLGKSSLLQAGLFPKLRALNFLPVALRLDYSEKAPPPEAQVRQALGEAFRVHQIDARPMAANESLWAYFHRDDLEFWDARNRMIIPVLVFDQFEERFTLGRLDEAQNVRADEFLTGLSQLVENRPPPALRAHFESDPDSALAYNFDKQTCKVVLSLREDFLPELDGLRDRFPAMANNQFRLLPMTRMQALDVARQRDSDLVSPEVAAAIVEFVAFSRQAGEGGEVEPALLSLVLQELNALRQKRGDARISADLLSGSKDKILEDFYEEAVTDLPEQARRFIEYGLLTGSGYRDSVALEKARSEFNLDDASLAALVNRHLVRREERLGSTRLELVHDLLTKVIMQSRHQRQELERLKEQADQEWRKKNDLAVRAAMRLNGIAAEWCGEPGSGGGLLVRGAFLVQANELLEQHPHLLSPEARDFIEASQRRWRRGRLWWALGAAAFLALFGVGEALPKSRDRHALQAFIVGVFFTVIPFVLPLLDRLPRRLRLRTLAGSAWRWSLYMWVAFLILCYFWLPSKDNEFMGGVIMMSPFFLIPLWKWKSYREGRRMALRPVKRLNWGARVLALLLPLLISAALILYKVEPGKFSKITKETQSLVNEAVPTVSSPAPVLTSYVEESTKRTIVLQQITKKTEAGEVIENNYFVPGETADGYQKSVVKEDRQGNELERSYFGTDEKPVLDKVSGVHLVRSAYNEQGHLTNEAYFGLDDQPALGKDGYALTTTKWDRGRQIEWACFDTAGQPAIDKSAGIHETQGIYDEAGRWTNWSFWGIDGRPALGKDGFASETARWNERNDQTDWACFGTNGEPVSNLGDNIHEWRKEFGAGTNWTLWANYDCQGHLTPPKTGVPKAVRKFDEHRHQIEAAYFGTNDEPILYASSGWHLCRTAYDEHGNWTNEVYLGINGQPVMSSDGYARKTAKWDTWGNRTEWDYFGPHDEPVVGQDGYHRRVAVYSGPDKIVSDQRFDTQGRLLPAVIAVGEVLPDGQGAAVGLQTGDVIWQYADWSLRSYPANADVDVMDKDLRSRLSAPGEAKRTLVVLRAGQLKTFAVAPGRLDVTLTHGQQILPKELLAAPGK